jgi:hypothetical protein
MTLSEVKALTFDVFAPSSTIGAPSFARGNSSARRKDCRSIGPRLPMPGALALVPRWLVSCRQECPGPISMLYTA